MASWTPKAPDFSLGDRNVLSKFSESDIKPETMEDIMENSERFPVKFPVDTGRLKSLKNKKNITEVHLTTNINSVYPFIHESVLKLYLNFIDFKQNHGSRIEKLFYRGMSLSEFVDRLLKKRAVMFMGRDDKYILLTGNKGSRNWETTGTDDETPPLVLKNCLSYDEVKLAAFLYVSSYSYFVNNGDRKNKAIYADDRSMIEDEGVIAGMIGPRMRKVGVMDFQEVVITAKQNTESNGYGNKQSVHKLFADFFEEENQLFEAVVQRKSTHNARYVDLKTPKGAIFDNQIYQKRLAIVFDCLLLEANHRAKEAGKTAYIHVVGLGLGVWRISDHQEPIFMECFYNRLIMLAEKLGNVSDICFSYINQESCGGYKDGDTITIPNHPSKGIKIHIRNRQPHERLMEAGKLLVVSYAWDGNALPGNEYWDGKLGSSGDSAAASSTQIVELHNPHINPLVCASNLRVATSSGEMLPIGVYLRLNK